MSAAVASGCATGMQLLTPDGKPLASAPPAPYRIAVLPVANAEKLGDHQPHGLRFTIAADALRDRLVARMGSLHAATEAFASATHETAVASGADLILEPRLKDAPTMEHVSMSDYWWASGLLWITTWIGGLLVPDSSYEARVAFECDFRNARDRDEAIGYTAVSGQTDLNFWDRNAFLTGGFFLSLIIPPFWTTDDTAITSESLSEHALDQVAGRITSFLKFELADREKDSYGQVLFTMPKNGAMLGATTKVAGVINGRHAINEILVTANGAPVPLADKIRSSIEQQGPRYFSEPFETDDIALQAGENKIVVQTTLFDDRRFKRWVSSRTLVVYGPATSAADAANNTAAKEHP